MSFSYDDNYNLISIKDFENVETIKIFMIESVE